MLNSANYVRKERKSSERSTNQRAKQKKRNGEEIRKKERIPEGRIKTQAKRKVEHKRNGGMLK